MLIAVDGTAASGKGTLAKQLAARLKLVHLDTGRLYRGVGLQLLRDGITQRDVSSEHAEKYAKNLDITIMDDPEIKADTTGQMASFVAVMEPVRAALLDRQRQFAENIPQGFTGAILDGRDIGTVILPHADYKFFVDADPRIRAQRRYDELQQHGIETDVDTVLDTLLKRDERDMKRTTAPLKPAENAIFVDTGKKTVEEMVTFALEFILQR